MANNEDGDTSSTEQPAQEPVVNTAEPVVEAVVEPTLDKKHNPVSDSKELHPSDDMGDRLILPGVLYNSLITALTGINKLSKEEFKRKYSDKEQLALGINIEGMRTGFIEDMLAKDADEFFNGINFGDKELVTRLLPLNTQGKNLKGAAVISAFSSLVGVGDNIQVPLWHSGFWVALRPVKDSEIVNLETALANNHIELGRDTSTLVYSNYSVVYNRIVTDFIIEHIESSTLAVPADKDIRDYIKIQDLYPLVNGMLSGMYTSGYEFIRACSNTATIGKDKKPACDYTLTAKVDFKKLLWVNRKAINKDMVRQESTRTPNAISADVVNDYQKILESLSNNQLKIKTSSGIDMVMTLSSPTLNDYIINGEIWINNVIKNSEKLFTETTNDEEKNILINEMMTTVVLGIYNVFIEKIEVPSKQTITEDRVDVDNALEILSSDDLVLKDLIDGVKAYINKITIALVGIPNYECPKCGTDQNESEDIVFKEIIPLNVVESFLDLCTHRTQKLRIRNIS